MFLSTAIPAQEKNGTPSFFTDVVLKVDTGTYSFSENFIKIKKEKKLFFYYTENDAFCEVKLYPAQATNIKDIKLNESGDFVLVDSILHYNKEYYKFKVQFKNLTKSKFLSFNFSVTTKDETGETHVQEIDLFPCTRTRISIDIQSDELFIGEEKVYDINSSNINNVQTNIEWQTGESLDYKITERSGQLRLHVLPKKLGNIEENITISTYKPYLNENYRPVYTLPTITRGFYVKSSRIAFLGTDKNEITLDEESRKKGVEIQIDNHRYLHMQKTYRIENQEERGGALIAELFTKNNLANDKVLAILRVFNYHRKSEGYLYIKDGDDAKFITNLDITPKTDISGIFILREGKDWSKNLNISPGEIFDLKIQGEALHKAKFQFEGLMDITEDSMIRNENSMIFKLKVPLDITRKKVTLYNYNKPTTHQLTVKEYQIPTRFDYLFINYGDRSRRVSQIKDYIIYDKTVKDVVFSFQPELIDQNNQLFGKQYLTIDVKVTGKRNELIDLKTIKNVVVCPDVSSPRYEYYDKKDCTREEVKLNNYISPKTYDLDNWAKIEFEVKHQDDKYQEEGFNKKIDLILQKDYTFDIDVSFPAGLLMKKANDDNYGNFGGISMAMIAQFSFYHPEKIGKLRPYKIGAGFLALNAFNFDPENTDRDLGVVILGSLYPSRKEHKLSFPLFVGGGYLLSESTWFWLLGPGIRVRL